MIFAVASLIDEGIVHQIVASGEHLGWFLALLQSPAVFLPSLARRCRCQSVSGLSMTGWWRRMRSGLRPAHAVVGFGIFISHGLSSAAVMHVNYTEQQIFKCGKVGFVMVASRLLLGTRLKSNAIAAAGVLISGLLLFSAADRLLQQATSMKAADQAELSAAASATAAAAMRFDLAGVAMLSLSLTASGFISVVQQMVMQQRGLHRLHWRTFVCMGGSRSVQTQQLHAPGTTTSKRKNGECGYSEVEPSRLGPKDDLLFFQNLIATPLLLVVCLSNGELYRGCRFFFSSGYADSGGAAGGWLLLRLVFSLVLYAAGTHVVFAISRRYGATTASIVVSFRRVVSFVLSFAIFPKPCTAAHVIGVILATLGAFWLQQETSTLSELSGESVAARKRGLRKQKFGSAADLRKLHEQSVSIENLAGEMRAVPLGDSSRSSAEAASGVHPLVAQRRSSSLELLAAVDGEFEGGPPEPPVDTLWVQTALRQLGFYSGQMDGVPGPKTSAAVASFQAVAGLDPAAADPAVPQAGGADTVGAGATSETLRALRLRIPSTDLRHSVAAAKRQLEASTAAGKK